MDDHRRALITRVVDGPGTASNQDRRDAFAATGPEVARALVTKVTQHAYRIIDEDIAAVKAAGASEDQIFELVVCAAVGQATRQFESALAALDEATSGNKEP